MFRWIAIGLVAVSASGCMTTYRKARGYDQARRELDGARQDLAVCRENTAMARRTIEVLQGNVTRLTELYEGTKKANLTR